MHSEQPKRSQIIQAMLKLQITVQYMIDSGDHDPYESHFNLFLKEKLEKELQLWSPVDDNFFYWVIDNKDYLSLNEFNDMLNELIIKCCISEAAIQAASQ